MLCMCTARGGGRVNVNCRERQNGEENEGREEGGGKEKRTEQK